MNSERPLVYWVSHLNVYLNPFTYPARTATPLFSSPCRNRVDYYLGMCYTCLESSKFPCPQDRKWRPSRTHEYVGHHCSVREHVSVISLIHCYSTTRIYLYRVKWLYIEIFFKPGVTYLITEFDGPGERNPVKGFRWWLLFQNPERNHIHVIVAML